MCVAVANFILCNQAIAASVPGNSALCTAYDTYEHWLKPEYTLARVSARHEWSEDLRIPHAWGMM